MVKYVESAEGIYLFMLYRFPFNLQFAQVLPFLTVIFSFCFFIFQLLKRARPTVFYSFFFCFKLNLDDQKIFRQKKMVQHHIIGEIDFSL